MSYNSMIMNIVTVINYLCIKENFIINVCRYNNDIRIDIASKNNEQIIYQKDFKNLKHEYNYLIYDLISIFCSNEVTISKLFKINNNLCQQAICSNNLEFIFEINSNNFIEVRNAAKRHYNFNNKAQKGTAFTKKKTNKSTLIVAG